MAFDVPGALPGFDRDAILAVETEIKRWVDGRGYNPDSATLPGGYFLNSDELNEARQMLDEAYGSRALVQQLGPGLLDTPSQADSPFQWVVAPGKADNRAFARMTVDRDTLRATNDPRVIALTQTYFNYRPERLGPLGALGNVTDALQGSGTRIGLEYAETLLAQKDNFMSEPGTRFIFDIEVPSIHERHGLRQFSARVVDESGKQVKEFNLHFDKSILGLGHWGPKTIGDVVGATELLPDAQMAEGMLEAFEWGAKSRYLIAQNGFFDVKYLLQLGESELYKQGKAALEADPNAVTTATRFKVAHDAFMAKTKTADFYDTAAHARMWMGNIPIAPELTGFRSGKAAGIANILLESSFLKDVVGMPDLETGRAMSARRVDELFGGATHNADVDTWVTHYLAEMEKRIVGGEDLLRHEPLGDKVLRHKIVTSRSVNIASGLTKDSLLELEKMGMIAFDDVGGAISTVTGEQAIINPMEQMMLLSRDLGMTSKSRGAAKVAAEGGWWGRFLDDRNIFTPDGELSLDARFPDIEAWRKVQKEAADKGLPFAGLSYIERQFSSILGGAVDQPTEGGMARMRQLAGAEMLVGEYQPTGLMAFPNRKAVSARNTAIPLNVLEQMEGRTVAGTDIPLLQGTKIGLARQGKAVQYTRLSALNFEKRGGGTIKDVAFNIRALDADEAISTQQISGIIDFLKTELAPEDQLRLLHGGDITQDILDGGMTPEHLAKYEAHLGRVEEGLQATGRTTGIQIGTAGGTRGGRGAALLSSLMKELNYDTDWGSDAFVAPLMPGEDNRLGPVMLARADSLDRPGVEGQVLSELNRQKTMYGRAEQEVGRNPRLLGWLEESQKVRGAGKAVVGALEGYQKIRNWMTPKKAAIGAAAGVAGYYLYRRSKREPTDDVLSQQPLEPTGFYEAYKEDLGESPGQPMGRVGGRSQPHPLATAGITQQLHDQRSGHHRMGPDKNDHLF